MAGKIFINYRRDDSIATAVHLHERLAQVFGRDNLFMDVDNIPFGVDFEEHLNSQVAACDVMLVVIGPNWLNAKDDTGQRRLQQPDDFVAIEITAALARNIRVIPVLVDGARVPKASELPDSLKPLARRQAAGVRNAHFRQDTETLLARMRGAFDSDSATRATGEAAALADQTPVAGGPEPPANKLAGPDRLLSKQRSVGWRRTAMITSAVAALLLIGWGGYAVLRDIQTTTHAPQQRDAELKAEQARSPKPVTATPGGATSAAQENIVNLLSPEQGGQLLAAPDENWRKLTSGKEDDWVSIRSGPEAEAVYAFKDRKPATFGKFAVLIKGTDSFNPKEIEILAGNDWPKGTFRPLVKCTVMNQVMLEARYQQCVFPETTAKYVKIRLLSSFHFNDWANLPQICLLGWLTQ